MSLEERMKYAAIKAKHRKQLRPWYKKPWGVTTIIAGGLLAIFLVGASLYVITEAIKISRGESARYLANQGTRYLEAINRRSANTYGPADAPITIVEFSDFSCPFCRSSYYGVRDIRNKYPDKVRIVYRDYPLHDNSIYLSLSARCAGEQGLFWQAHDIFFEHQERLNVPAADLELLILEIANALKLNLDQFQNCLASQRHFTQISQDYEDGEFLQIEGTPTWFINNNRLVGALTTEDLDKIVSGLLLLEESK